MRLSLQQFIKNLGPNERPIRLPSGQLFANSTATCLLGDSVISGGYHLQIKPILLPSLPLMQLKQNQQHY